MKSYVALLITIQMAAAQVGAPAPEDAAAKAMAVEQRAWAGEPAAMAEMGRIYLNGNGRPKDPGQAMEWFMKGAAAGNAAAQVGVGYLLSRGIGCPVDKAGAGDWFRRAAEQKDAKGQYNLALLLHEGSLGPGRIPEALDWFKKAAAQGMVEAQAALGDMYFMAAEHVPRDFAAAAYWLEKAAAGGDNPSRTVFGSMLRFGTGVTADKPRAYGLFLGAAREGYAKAMCQLADMLAAGEGAAKDPVQAASWYLAAAELGESVGKDRWELLKPGLTQDQIQQARQLAPTLVRRQP